MSDSQQTREQREQREQEFHDRVYGSGEYHDRPAAKFYTIAGSAYRFYEDQLWQAATEGADVLEYGCGDGSYAFELARRGARVTGIDISPVAIEQAREQAKREGVEESTTFEVMNCEDLTYADQSFDLICGGGILHHIDLDKGYAELNRTLRDDGVAAFLEPMGHNPLINLYRNRTPELRTEDEHPLLESDLADADLYFGSVDATYFNLLSLAAVPLRGRRGFDRANGVLDGADRWLFERVPRLRKHAWMVTLVFAGPRRGV
jgi:SAM-dependent methyltransferase